MARRPFAWYAAVELPRPTAWFESGIPRTPVIPFITHALHPSLLRLIERIGTVRKLSAGEEIFSPCDPVDQVTVVRKGITGRALGHDGNAIGLSIPGRFASGNLNFFTGFPCFGRYFALIPSEIITAPKDLLIPVLRGSPEAALLFARQFEMAKLSDRLGFAILSSCSVELRLAAFYYAWAASYGHTVQDEAGDTWIRMPPPIQRHYIANVVNTSRLSIDRFLKQWKDKNLSKMVSEELWVQPSLLEPIHAWICDKEEISTRVRPASLLDSIWGDKMRDPDSESQAVSY